MVVMSHILSANDIAFQDFSSGNLPAQIAILPTHSSIVVIIASYNHVLAAHFHRSSSSSFHDHLLRFKDAFDLYKNHFQQDTTTYCVYYKNPYSNNHSRDNRRRMRGVMDVDLLLRCLGLPRSVVGTFGLRTDDCVFAVFVIGGAATPWVLVDGHLLRSV